MTWRYECQHVATAVSLVAAGLGVAVLPRLSIDGSGERGVVAVPLRNPGITRTLGVISKRGLPLSPAATALLSLIRKQLKAEAKRVGDP
jgi:DNA-binding transcriptional LysR family regulator